MSRLFRFRPRRSLTAWLLILLCWLSLAVPTAGAPPGRRSHRQCAQAQVVRPLAQYPVRRAEITLSVADVQRTVIGLEELARTVRGRFAGDGMRIFDLSNGLRGVEATLELPPEMLDTALARLRGMALIVLGEQVESRDVSGQVDALNRHLEQLRATRRRLGDLLDQATTDAERRQVETALAAVEAGIADAEATMSALLQDVDWAVIHILAHEAPPTPTPPPTLAPSPIPTATLIPVTPSPTPWRPGETVRRATNVLLSIVRGLTDVLIVVTIVGGPFLVLAMVGWWIRGRVRG